MKKLWFALFVLTMTMVACAGPIQTQSPTTVPLLPTQAPESTLDRPTEVATLPVEVPTEIPPTPVPPTEVPPTEILPTELPLVPTEVPTEVWEFIPGVASGAEIVFQEDFTDPKLDWPESSSERTTRAFVDGEFYVKVIDTDRVGWNTVPDVVYNHDVVLDADVRGGVNFAEDAEAGFVCGFENSDNLYRMAVGADGEVKFVRKQNGENKTIFTSNVGIPLNPAGSHLTGVCTQSEISLYVNRQLVGTYAIDGLAAGKAGILAGSNDTGNVELYFDNFFISKGPYVFPPTEEPTKVWGFIPGVASGTEIVLEYDFSEPKFGWGDSTETIKRAFVNGEFYVNIIAKNYLSRNIVQDIVYNHDVVLDIDVRGGVNFAEDAEAGFVCGYENSNNFYRMSFEADGGVIFVRKQNGENKTIYSSSEQVTLDPSGVHLTGICTKSELSLYVNRQLVGTLPLDGLPAGSVGFMGGSNATDNVELYFDNFFVSQGPYMFAD